MFSFIYKNIKLKINPKWSYLDEKESFYFIRIKIQK
jgi:hypothetical protein